MSAGETPGEVPSAAAPATPPVVPTAVPVAAPVAVATPPVATAVQAPVATAIPVATAVPVAAPIAVASAPVAAPVAAPVVAAPVPASPAPAPVPTAAASPPPAKPAAAPIKTLPPRKLLIGQHKTDWKKLGTTVLISFMIHVLALCVCWFIPGGSEFLQEIVTTVASMNEAESEPIVESSPVMPDDLKETTDADATPQTVAATTSDIPVPVNLNIDNLAPTVVINDLSSAGETMLKAGNELHGRASAANKAAMLKAFGGNTASEAAVISGMKWIANHQLADGSWSFNHTKCSKDCDCKQSGLDAAPPNAATALALLSFMGGGHTHQKGDYQPVMKKGVDFLLKAGKTTPNGIDFSGGNVANYAMYTHGMAALALTEAAALTKDPRLRTASQGAIRFIVAVQDPKSGGWRYQTSPQAGDTSVSGWQIMALKSAKNANIPVPPLAFKGAEKFLDSMEIKSGPLEGRYRYDAADEKAGHAAMTPTALLCRMYLGWDEKKPQLKKGVEIIDKAKPPGDMYYNYYATQVQHHWGGEEWKRWNNVMRDRLVTTQKRSGHEAGSWDLSVGHGEAGGRLWMTTLSVMTLEVYYRHLPLYQRENVKVDF